MGDITMTASFTEEIDRAYQSTRMTAEQEAERERREKSAKIVARMELRRLLDDMDKTSADDLAERLAGISERLADWES